MTSSSRSRTARAGLVLAAAVLALPPTAGGAGAAPPRPSSPSLPMSAAPAPPAPDAAALARLDPEPDAVPGVRPAAPCPAAVPPVGLDLDAARGADPAAGWTHGRGEGQLVAVVDTGVAPHPRLAGRVVDGGDFVAGDSGLDDCDGHGTAVAGLLAAAPAADDLLVGSAPGVRVLAVRQSSAFSATPRGPGVGDVTTLARAVRHAARTPGVGVLTLSLAACSPPAAAATPAVGALRAAVREAVDRGVVVIAAAGNATGADAATGGTGGGVTGAGVGDAQSDDSTGRGANGGCGPQNTPGGLATVAVPGWFDDDVLTVGAVDDDGTPDPRSLAGPWVDVAAPARASASLAARGGGLTTALPGPDSDPSPLVGTSFAAPRVAAVAALLRQQFPDMPAREVAARIVRSAQPPPGLAAGSRDDAVGYGTVDAAAAVAGGPPRTGPGVTPADPAPAASTAGTERTGLAVTAGAGVVIMAALVIMAVRRRGRRRTGGGA